MADPIEITPANNNQSTSNVTYIVQHGVTVNNFYDYGSNTTIINRGVMGSNYQWAYYTPSGAATVINAVNGSMGTSGSVFAYTPGNSAITNYGILNGNGYNYNSGGLTVHNYGFYSGSSSNSTSFQVDLFTGSTNGTVGAPNVPSTINLLLDDRPTTAANADVGANSGTTTGTIHDLNSFGTLNVKSGNWSLGSNETFTTTTTVSSGATLGVAGYTLTTASLSLVSGAIVHDVEGASGGFSVSGSVNLGGATLDLGTGSAGAVGSMMLLVNNTGTAAVQGMFAGLAEGSSLTASGHSYSISYTGGTGNDVVLTRIADAVTGPPSGNSYDLSMLSPGDQTGFTANDRLYIPVATADLVLAPISGGVTLTYNGQNYNFADGTLSKASQAYHVSLADNTQLLVGTDTGNDSLFNPAKANNIIYGFGGDDDINVGSGNNYINGGTGNDIVYAYDGNNHIWGNAQNTVQGQVDGADRIIINGGGSNYVNGNAGDDIIEAGKDGSTGVNRLYGGQGNDTITIHGAGANTANGNLGNDTINASDATGNNQLRGGQGDDVVRAGHGQDQLMGDLGNDVLVAGTGTSHLTVMTGGAGADTFDFSRGAQAAVTINSTTYYSGVTDFTHGTDHVGFAFAVGSGDLLTTSNSFADVASAQAYAQQALAVHAGTTDVAALQVGSDTYLFYDAAGSSDAVDSVVHLNGVTAATLTTGDFSMIAA